MLGHQVLETYVGNTKTKGTVDSECPQGGVISPLLWFLVVNDLLLELTRQGCLVILYADDI